MVAFPSLFEGCRCWLFVGGNGCAAHKVLKARRRKYEGHANGVVADGLYTHPGVGGNEHHATGVEVAFLIAEVDMNGASVDGDNFILPEMLDGNP